MIDIGWLAQNGPCKKFSEGQRIPCPGCFGDSERAMYIVIAGRVDVTEAGKNNPTAISLSPGDVFGGLEYFTDQAENIYTAAADSIVYVISESSFSELSWSQPDTVFEIIKAAYIPQGKPAAQEKAAQKKTEPAASVKTKTAANLKTEQNAKSAPEPEKTPKTDTASDPASSPSALQAAIPPTEAIFPEGHKGYPGITKPNYSRLIYQKDYTCPFCKKKFKDYKIFSSKLYESAPMRYDLRKFYTDFQTEWYDVITCKHCYFSTVHSYYTDSKPILKKKIEDELSAARASILLDFDAERDIDFVFTSHYLALLCAGGYLAFANPVRAKIWGNLSWLYEDVGDETMERFAAEKAAIAYEDVFTGTRMTPVQEQTTCLSIAGMQMRAGIDRDMKKFLFQVKTAKLGEKAYVKMAEDLMDEIRAK